MSRNVISLPRVIDRRFLKRHPRTGDLFEVRVVVMRRRDWEGSPEAGESDWDVVEFGPIVFASQTVF